MTTFNVGDRARILPAAWNKDKYAKVLANKIVTIVEVNGDSYCVELDGHEKGLWSARRFCLEGQHMVPEQKFANGTKVRFTSSTIPGDVHTGVVRDFQPLSDEGVRVTYPYALDLDGYGTKGAAEDELELLPETTEPSLLELVEAAQELLARIKARL